MSRLVLIVLAVGLAGCARDTGDVGFGVSGLVRSASTHEPLLNAWATFDDTTAVARTDGRVDSVGNFAVGTWGCGERQLYVGAGGYLTYDTTIVSDRCQSFEGLVIELVESPERTTIRHRFQDNKSRF